MKKTEKTDKGARITTKDVERMRAGNTLDELVHRVKDQEASEINNKGVAAQLDFLRKSGMNDEQILDAEAE